MQSGMVVRADEHRYIAAHTHPDHDTLATFRRRFGPQLDQLFVQVLMLAREMGMRPPKVSSHQARHSSNIRTKLSCMVGFPDVNF